MLNIKRDITLSEACDSKAFWIHTCLPVDVLSGESVTLLLTIVLSSIVTSAAG